MALVEVFNYLAIKSRFLLLNKLQADSEGKVYKVQSTDVVIP